MPQENPIVNFAQKALYLGMGLASLVADKTASVAGRAGFNLSELRKQAQGLVDELVERGAMTAEEARAYMDNLVKQQQGNGQKPEGSAAGPRKITIDDIEEGDANGSTAIELTEAARLRQQIDALRLELERLKKQS